MQFDKIKMRTRTRQFLTILEEGGKKAANLSQQTVFNGGSSATFSEKILQQLTALLFQDSACYFKPVIKLTVGPYFIP